MKKQEHIGDTAINSNMFGPDDRTGEHAHVIGALMQKFVTAVKEDHKRLRYGEVVIRAEI